MYILHDAKLRCGKVMKPHRRASSFALVVTRKATQHGGNSTGFNEWPATSGPRASRRGGIKVRHTLLQKHTQTTPIKKQNSVKFTTLLSFGGRETLIVRISGRVFEFLNSLGRWSSRKQRAELLFSRDRQKWSKRVIFPTKRA